MKGGDVRPPADGGRVRRRKQNKNQAAPTRGREENDGEDVIHNAVY